MEANEVGGEHPLEHILSDWQDFINFGGREGDVKEPTDGTTRLLKAEHFREDHEVVVVYPHGVPVFIHAYQKVWIIPTSQARTTRTRGKGRHGSGVRE